MAEPASPACVPALYNGRGGKIFDEDKATGLRMPVIPDKSEAVQVYKRLQRHSSSILCNQINLIASPRAFHTIYTS